MYIVLNVIILIFEVLYYGLFMYFSKREGKIWKYFLNFLLITIVGLFIGVNSLISYLILVLLMILGLKYIVRVKTTLFDMLMVIIMLLSKLFVEVIIISIFAIFIKKVYILSTIAGIIKIILIIIVRKVLSKNYKVLKKIWDNNNFYIRYLFSIVVFLYTIISCLVLIF